MKSLFSTVTMLWVAMFLSAPLAHAGASEDLAAFKEVQQTKLDAQKELQQKEVEGLRRDIDAVNKRVDDQLAQVGQAVDRFGVLAAWISLGITVLLAVAGFLGIGKVKAEAKDEARSQSEKTAESWFERRSTELQRSIDELDAKARSVHQRMEDSAQAAESKSDEVLQSMQLLQDEIGKDSAQVTPELTSARNTVQARATELEKEGEDRYSFEDWNARAHAAYAEQSWEQAAYFWRRAANVPQAEAVNVARVLFNRGVVQGRLGQPEAELKTYDEVLSRFGKASEFALREQVGRCLVNMGVCWGGLGQKDKEIEAYEEVLRRFEDAPEPELRVLVGRALLNKAVVQSQMDKADDAMRTIDLVLEKFEGADGFVFRELVAMALLQKGATQGRLDRSEEAVKTYDALLFRFGEATQISLRELVARALVNKGNSQGKMGQADEAIKTYDEVLHRFGGASELGLMEPIAVALLAKGAREVQLGKSADATTTYDQVLRRFGEATEPMMRMQVASALIQKGVALDEIGRSDEAINAYDEVLQRFGKAEEQDLRRQIFVALNGMGFSRLMQAKQAINRSDVPGALTSSSVQTLLHKAIANFNEALVAIEPESLPLSGAVLGNRAYVQCLLGHHQQARSDFEAALRAPEFGGHELYDATLKDLDRYPIEQDQVMRDLVEKAWKAYRQEHPPKPPAQ